MANRIAFPHLNKLCFACVLAPHMPTSHGMGAVEQTYQACMYPQQISIYWTEVMFMAMQLYHAQLKPERIKLLASRHSSATLQTPLIRFQERRSEFNLLGTLQRNHGNKTGLPINSVHDLLEKSTHEATYNTWYYWSNIWARLTIVCSVCNCSQVNIILTITWLTRSLTSQRERWWM